MKHLLRFAFLFLLLSSFQCDKNETNSQEVTPELLQQKKQEIFNYINSFTCNGSGCSSIAFGAKPCGGPWQYLLYPNSVNVTTLTQMVDEYNQLEQTFNENTGAISDCMFVTPPTNVVCNGEAGCVAQ